MCCFSYMLGTMNADKSIWVRFYAWLTGEWLKDLQATDKLDVLFSAKLQIGKVRRTLQTIEKDISLCSSTSLVSLFRSTAGILTWLFQYSSWIVRHHISNNLPRSVITTSFDNTRSLVLAQAKQRNRRPPLYFRMMAKVQPAAEHDYHAFFFMS